MKFKLWMLLLPLFVAVAGISHAALPAPDLNIDVAAQGLPDGELPTWFNAGSLSGQFDAMGATPVVGTVAGKRAVTFNGNNGYRLHAVGTDNLLPFPGYYSGSQPYTVTYWVYNPGIQGTERIFGWTDTNIGDYQSCIFCFGTNASYGVVNHWGSQNDMGFDRGIPSQMTWHNISVTYSGVSGWEKVYIDGVINAIEKKPDSELNNAAYGGPVWIGCTREASGDQNFSGSLASIKVYAAEGQFADVIGVSGCTSSIPILGKQPVVVNPGFELSNSFYPQGPPSTSNTSGGNRIIPGWCTSEQFISGSPARTQIGNYAKNIGLTSNGGPWDNGMNWDGGTRVLAIASPTTPMAVSQWINTRASRTYHIRIHANASSTGSAILSVYMDGVKVGSSLPVDPVDSPGSFFAQFYEWEANWSSGTAGQGCHELKIENSNVGDGSVLLIDDVTFWDNNCSTPIVYPALTDFGQAGRTTTSTVEKVLTITNTSSRNMVLTYNGTAAASGGFGGDVARFAIIGSVPGTHADPDTNANTPNITIEPYGSYQMTIRFTANTVAKTYTGTRIFRWSNTTYSDEEQIRFTALVPTTPTVLNGGFEAPLAGNAYSANSWYESYGDNKAIPYWQQTDEMTGTVYGDANVNVGLGVSDRNAQITDGNIPEGRQAFWIQSWIGYYPNLRGIRQNIGGWDPTKTYRISMYADSRNINSGLNYLIVRVKGPGVSGTGALSAKQNPSTGGFANGQLSAADLGTSTTVRRANGNWYNVYYDFKPPTGGQYTLEIQTQNRDTANATSERNLYVDKVTIYQYSGQGKSSVPVLYNNQAPLRYTGTVGVQSPNQGITIKNEGGTNLTLSNLSITGPNAKQFRMVTSGSYTIPAFGGGSTINVAFKPTTIGGIADAYARWTTTDTSGTAGIQVPLYGVGYNFPIVQNPSFEMPLAYWGNDGQDATYWNVQCQSVQGGVPGWSTGYTGSNGIGGVVGYAKGLVGSDFFNNGVCYNGTQAYWMQGGTSGSGSAANEPKWVQQKVEGFYTATPYHYKAWVNARANGDQIVTFNLQCNGQSGGNTELIPYTDLTAVDPVDTFTHTFTLFEGDFTLPASGYQTIQFNVPNQADDSTLLIDNLEISGPAPNAIKNWNMFE